MEESGMDFWMVLSRENCEDPIIHTLFTWDMPEARRISVLLFHRNGEGKIRKMAVGMHSPEMSHIYENVQKKEEDVWQTVKRGGRNFTGKNRSKPELFVRLLRRTFLDLTGPAEGGIGGDLCRKNLRRRGIDGSVAPARLPAGKRGHEGFDQRDP